VTKRARLLLVSAAAVVALVVWALVPASEKPFYDYLDERRAAGLANSFEELLGPMPPDAENGAAELEASIPWVLATCGPSSSWKNSPFDATLALEDYGPTREQIEGETPAAVQIRPWTDRRNSVLAAPHLRFAITLLPSGMRSASHMQCLQNAQRLLCMQADAEDDPIRRLAACRATLLFARRIEPETLMTWMVGTAIESGGVTSLRRDVEWGRIDPAAARAACDELLAGSRVDGTRRALRVCSVDFLTAYRELIEGRAVPRTAGQSWWQRTSRRVERLVSRLRGVPEYPELEPGMAHTVVSICRGLDAAAAADLSADLSKDGVDGLDPTGTLRECGIDGIVVHVMSLAVQTDAQTRLARVALAVAAHREEHGAFPASLDELRAAFPDGVPNDPYTDAAFVYEPTKDGVRISSAGRFPGTPAPEEDTRRAQQLVWELKR
jgi:hypothetical protein